MDYPVYVDGVRRGTLTVTQEGLRTRFTASCEMTAKIIRLRVFGEGISAYLGVPCPEGDRMVFSKVYTKNELRTFPQNIEYAADAEKKTEADKTKWVMSTKGCLVWDDGREKYIAIPADGKRLEKTGLVRNIDGREYLVFRR